MLHRAPKILSILAMAVALHLAMPVTSTRAVNHHNHILRKAEDNVQEIEAMRRVRRVDDSSTRLFLAPSRSQPNSRIRIEHSAILRSTAAASTGPE